MTPLGQLIEGRTGHDQTMHRLDIPAGFDELHGQPIEQFAMAGHLALQTKVLGGFDDAGPKVTLPNPIDGDSSGQRVFTRDHPACQFQTILRLACVRGRQQGRGNASRQRIVFHRLIVLAAIQKVGRLRIRLAFSHHHHRNTGTRFLHQRVVGGGELLLGGLQRRVNFAVVGQQLFAIRFRPILGGFQQDVLQLLIQSSHPLGQIRRRRGAFDLEFADDVIRERAVESKRELGWLLGVGWDRFLQQERDVNRLIFDVRSKDSPT